MFLYGVPRCEVLYKGFLDVTHEGKRRLAGLLQKSGLDCPDYLGKYAQVPDYLLRKTNPECPDCLRNQALIVHITLEITFIYCLGSHAQIANITWRSIVNISWESKLGFL